MEHETLATELLKELRATAKRWFIIALVELGIIIAIIAGFLYYLSLPVEEYSDSISQIDTTKSLAVIGGGNNGLSTGD